DAAFRVDQFLLAREERVAVRADFEVQLVLGRTGLPLRAAGAPGLDVVVFRVNSFSHSELLTLFQETSILAQSRLCRCSSRPGTPDWSWSCPSSTAAAPWLRPGRAASGPSAAPIRGSDPLSRARAPP